ncbi:serine hydroxymethyltransferase [Actinomycetospora sp. NBRC 106375]|uniref:glycine hydroxymethyltransferase n=1 Tax=Actinomycetospora sp. NBRC 106375 TaxID=3032207 RepID=UPI0024A19BCB|nr:glycine hydroxymethyltransferase [Actinomycetospora sp. NBRC 106375]GLZ50132.1 serine hydroxymethyltransferase [Actinomycetospora sp. NBRC 106375]
MTGTDQVRRVDAVDTAPGDLLRTYLARTDSGAVEPEVASFYASVDAVAAVDPEIARAVMNELSDQRSNIKLIASENYCSPAVQAAHANLLTDKYAEGYPGHRFYAGCENVDDVESRAAAAARELFGAEHAYVQPHSGADANLVAYLAILAHRVEAPELAARGEKNPARLGHEDWEQLRRAATGQRLLGLDLYSGGHLTHGYRHNVSSRLFDAHSYGVDPQTGLIDLAHVRARAQEVRPAVLLAGYSAYPRAIDFAAFREIADEVGATFMVDMAHFAGLVAGRVFTGDQNPVPHAHVVTSTTHKTLRGPRGGLVLSTGEYADAVDKGCPTVLGGPLSHVMAAKAVAFREALAPSFRTYAAAVVDNARALAAELGRRGGKVLTGGTDNHLLLLDVWSSFGLTGRQAESALRDCGLTVNRNALPGDTHGPWYTSGLRLGTPAVTTLGMRPDEIAEIAELIRLTLDAAEPRTAPYGTGRARYDLPDHVRDTVRGRARDLLARFPLYPGIDLGAAQRVPA